MQQDNGTDDCQEPLVIPNDQRPTVEALQRRHEVAKITLECATARYKNAVKSGDVDMAVQEFDTGRSIENDCNLAVDAFWEHIRTIFPEVTDGKEWNYDMTTHTISRRASSPFMEMLSGLVK